MRFKDQQVWVRAGDDGRPLLDGAGRAEMKYRETDSKSYRPSPGNLIPEDGAQVFVQDAPVATPPSAEPRRQSAGRRLAPAIEVWTDGACSGNPGPMGIGVVVIDGGERKELGEYLGIGTNNIAELTAIERGLDVAGQLGKGDGTRRIRIYSDSAYAIGLLEKGWKAKANQELVGRLRRKVSALAPVEFVKVAGHAGVPENERCDELARNAIIRRAAV
jgi:ribonuclease HI